MGNILIVSAKDKLDSKINLLTMGADDYITKPFEIKELAARGNVWLRRSKNTYSDLNKVIENEELIINKLIFAITIGGEKVNFTRQEFRIMELLFSNPNKVFSKQEIYNYAWEEYYAGVEKTINVHISNIRNKIIFQ